MTAAPRLSRLPSRDLGWRDLGQVALAVAPIGQPVLWRGTSMDQAIG